jgi:hypothetical protein
MQRVNFGPVVGVRTAVSQADSAPSPRGHRHLPGLVAGALVLALGAWSVMSHETSYAASATVVLVGPPTLSQLEVTTGQAINPNRQSELARFGDPTVVGDIFARIYQSRTKYDELVAAGLRGRLTVTTKREVLSDEPDHGPVLVFTMISPSPSDAIAGTTMVAADLQRELGQRQVGADPALNVTATVVSVADEALPVKASRVRSAVAFFALALLVGWLTGKAFGARANLRADAVSG